MDYYNFAGLLRRTFEGNWFVTLQCYITCGVVNSRVKVTTKSTSF